MNKTHNVPALMELGELIKKTKISVLENDKAGQRDREIITR